MPRSRRSIPILMYHKVGAPVHTKADTFLNVSKESFERQVRHLARLGFRGITFEQAARGLFDGDELPPKPVCVTFDDGYVNVMEYALPVLRRVDWPATVFVPTAYVGRSNLWDEPLGHPILPIMDWSWLKALHDEGWEMSGHTASHPNLAELPDSEAEREMRQGRETLESNLSTTVSTFCYPFGKVGVNTPALCKRAGFRAACTTKSGLATPDSDSFLLPRVKIAYRDSVIGLLYRIFLRPHLP